MVTIDIDGVKVEGETLKQAQRLAKKEQAKRAAAERERALARLHCYAQIGHWAEYLDTNESLPPAHCPIPRGSGYGDGFFLRQVKSNDDDDVLRIESECGNATYKCYGYRVVALIENGGGWLIGAKLTSTKPDGEPDYYITTYAVDDVASVTQVPKYIGAALDKKMNARLAAAAVSL